MPSSWIDCVPAIVNTALALRPRRVLDVGMGSGKYGYLLREQMDLACGRHTPGEWQHVIEGVEGFSGYIGDHQRAVYDRIHEREALSFLAAHEGERYDLGLAIDIIEHFEPQEGVTLVRAMLRVCDTVIVSTPRGFFAQSSESNELERHRSWWPAAALRKAARQCEAHVSIGRVHMSSVALFTRSRDTPAVVTRLLRTVLRAGRDAIVPERLYYRLLGGTGPSIL